MVRSKVNTNSTKRGSLNLLYSDIHVCVCARACTCGHLLLFNTMHNRAVSCEALSHKLKVHPHTVYGGNILEWDVGRLSGATQISCSGLRKSYMYRWMPMRWSVLKLIIQFAFVIPLGLGAPCWRKTDTWTTCTYKLWSWSKARLAV